MRKPRVLPAVPWPPRRKKKTLPIRLSRERTLPCCSDDSGLVPAVKASFGGLTSVNCPIYASGEREKGMDYP